MLTAIAFLLMFFCGIALALVRHPVWGLYTYIAVYYLDPYSRWWSESLPSLRWSLIIAAITMLVTVFYKHPPRKGWLRHGPIWVVVVYVIWMWLQTFWSITEELHPRGLEIFTKYLIVLYLVYTLIDNRERLIGFMFAHVMGCFYLGLVAFSSYTGGRLDGVGGPGIDDANSLGMQLGTGTLCAGALYLILKDWRRWAAAASLPFMLNALVMTGSRGAFLSLIAGGAAMAYMRPKRQIRKLAIYIVAGVALFGYVASDFFWERIISIGMAATNIEEADQSASSRLEIIKQQWEMAKHYPFGTGHKGTEFLSYSYLSDEHMSAQGGRSSHNTLMSALVDQGFVGLFLWLLLIWLLYRRYLRLRDYHRSRDDIEMGWLCAGCFGALTCYWAGGMFAPLLKAEVYMWLIALACASSSLHSSQVNEIGRITADKHLSKV